MKRKSKRNVENLRRKFENIQENKVNSVENLVENSVKNAAFCPNMSEKVRIFNDLDCQIEKSCVIGRTDAPIKQSTMIGCTNDSGDKAIRVKCSKKGEFLGHFDQMFDPNGLKKDSLSDSRRSGKRKYPFFNSNFEDFGEQFNGVIRQHRKQVRISSLETGFETKCSDQLEMGSDRGNT